MEASEKPQLSIEEPRDGSAGVVRALDDRLVIERLTVDDPGVARVVREHAERGRGPVETVSKAIEIGARVIDNEATTVNVDYVRRELQGGLGELNKELAGTLEAGGEELAERIAATFGADRSGSVQQQIKEIVASASERQRLELTKLLSAEDKSNPLLAVQARLSRTITEADERHRQEMGRLREAHANESRSTQRQVFELKEQVARLAERREADELIAEAEAAGTRKGLSFEERVHDAVERIARSRGDCATHTGGAQAEGGGRKGDILVELEAAEGPAAGRMVFEVKDKRLSKNDAWNELNEGMAARAAGFAVLVVAGEDRVPAGREPLQEYEGNKLIVAVDRDQPGGLALEAAYRLAAARLRLSRDGDLQVDPAAVRDASADAISTLKQAQAIRSTLTGIKTSSDKARAGLDAMVEAVRARLERIESLIADADQD
jgi:hypothetical protein